MQGDPRVPFLEIYQVQTSFRNYNYGVSISVYQEKGKRASLYPHHKKTRFRAEPPEMVKTESLCL